MSAYTIRPATVDDLPQIADVYDDAEAGGSPKAPRNPEPPALFRHELETGTVLVAERGGRLAGFAAVLTRDGAAYLSECFVRREAQSGGVGAALVREILASRAGRAYTVSSADHRAASLYVRAGLQPRWPLYRLHGESARLRDVPDPGVEMAEAVPRDPAFLRRDAELVGYGRPEDHGYWLDHARGVPFWFRRSGRTVGYGYVQQRSEDAAALPDAVTVGPIGVGEDGDAAACVLAAVRWARDRSALVRAWVPGPHASLGPLLACGFRMVEVETFLAAPGAPRVDPERYLPGITIF